MLRRTFCLLPAAALLSACGFQLRRARAMPFSSIYLPAIRGELGTRIRQGLQDSGVEIVTDVKQAEVRLDIAVAGRDREILSLSGEGKVREYEIIQRIRFALYNRDGTLRLAPVTLEARRDYTYDDTMLLAKQQEENLLWQDIDADLARRVLDRLAAATPQ